MLINIVGGPRQITLDIDPEETINDLKAKLFEELRKNTLGLNYYI